MLMPRSECASELIVPSNYKTITKIHKLETKCSFLSKSWASKAVILSSWTRRVASTNINYKIYWKYLWPNRGECVHNKFSTLRLPHYSIPYFDIWGHSTNFARTSYNSAIFHMYSMKILSLTNTPYFLPQSKIQKTLIGLLNADQTYSEIIQWVLVKFRHKWLSVTRARGHCWQWNMILF